MNRINRELVTECLRELSGYQLQRTLWLSPGGERVSSFIEVVEQLFTDSGLGDELQKGSTGLGRDAERALLLLDKQLTKVNRKQPPEKLIDDVEMKQVRELAARILDLIEATKPT